MGSNEKYGIGVVQYGRHQGKSYMRYIAKLLKSHLPWSRVELYLWWLFDKDRKHMSSQELAAARNVTLRTAQRYIADLKDAGLVEELEDHKYGIV